MKVARLIGFFVVMNFAQSSLAEDVCIQVGGQGSLSLHLDSIEELVSGFPVEILVKDKDRNLAKKVTQADSLASSSSTRKIIGFGKKPRTYDEVTSTAGFVLNLGISRHAAKVSVSKINGYPSMTITTDPYQFVCMPVGQ